MLEEGVEKYRNDKYMSIYIDAGWKKLTEYYRKTDQALAYIAVIVLNLTKKWFYFRDWEPECQTSAKQSLKTFWEQSYCFFTGLVQRVDLANTDIETSNNTFQQ